MPPQACEASCGTEAGSSHGFLSAPEPGAQITTFMMTACSLANARAVSFSVNSRRRATRRMKLAPLLHVAYYYWESTTEFQSLTPNCLDNKMLGSHMLRQKLTPVCIEGKRQTYHVLVPEMELFRYHELIQDACYSILDARSHDGPLNIVDVGANLGLFAAYMKSQNSDCRIHCFEPVRSTFSLLKKNTKKMPGVECYHFGLSDCDTKASINIHGTNTGQNSIKFESKGGGTTETVELHDAGREFDRLGLGHFDVLKIDTEGCEIEILRSLGARLDSVDYILVEYHSEADRRKIDGLLENYTLFGASAPQVGLGTLKYIRNSML